MSPSGAAPRQSERGGTRFWGNDGSGGGAVHGRKRLSFSEDSMDEGSAITDHSDPSERRPQPFDKATSKKWRMAATYAREPAPRVSMGGTHYAFPEHEELSRHRLTRDRHGSSKKLLFAGHESNDSMSSQFDQSLRELSLSLIHI